MSLIICPECGNQISSKATACPFCGLPAAFFYSVEKMNSSVMKEGSLSYSSDTPQAEDLQNLGNILVSFDKDYTQLMNQMKW